MPYPLGVVHIVFGSVALPDAARRAQELGFAHIDVPAAWEGTLALPVGDRIAQPSPQPGCSCPAPPAGEGMWDRAVRAYRRTPQMMVEPWPGSIVDSVEAARALVAEVEGLRLLVDTGHVACWGEDPVDLLDLAGHVQLRQARRGVAQTLEGDVDFAAVRRRLEQTGYDGKVSVEYFDLPDLGWSLADPVGHATALADRLRAGGWG